MIFLVLPCRSVCSRLNEKRFVVFDAFATRNLNRWRICAAGGFHKIHSDMIKKKKICKQLSPGQQYFENFQFIEIYSCNRFGTERGRKIPIVNNYICVRSRNIALWFQLYIEEIINLPHAQFIMPLTGLCIYETYMTRMTRMHTYYTV